MSDIPTPKVTIGAVAAVAATAGFALLAVLPVTMMLAKAFVADGAVSLVNFQSLAADARQAGLLLRSLVLAGGATLCALVMGVPVAFCIHRARTVGLRFIKWLYLLPLTIPPQIFAATWVTFASVWGPAAGTAPGSSADTVLSGTLAAMVLLALAYHPLLIVTTLAGLGAVDRRLEEAAGLVHPPATVLRRITLPLIGPYLATGAVFVFLFSLFNYSVPALLNIHTYPVEIFAQFSAFYNEGRAAALALPLIVTALLLMGLVQNKMGARAFFTLGSGSRPPEAGPRSRIDSLLAGWSWIVISLSVFVPLAVLLHRAADFQVITAVLKTSSREIVSTLLLSATAAVVIVLIAYPMADRIAGRKKTAWQWLDLFSLLPFAIPATVLGIGIIYLWNRPLLDRVYGSAAILVIALAARFLPFAVRALVAGFGQVAPSLREAAMLYESSNIRRWLKIEWPLLKRGIGVSWLIAFILCMNELGATLLVIPPGHGTLSLKIYNLMHYGANQMVAGMALLLVGINLAAAGIVSKLCITRKVYGP